jgi:hypothetical protein
MLLLLPVHYIGPVDAVGGGCCVEAVSRAFAIPLLPSGPFVDLAADVLGQSSELLEAYLQAAAAAQCGGDDDTSAVVHTVLAIVIYFSPPPYRTLTHNSPPPKARHPSLENSIRLPNSTPPTPTLSLTLMTSSPLPPPPACFLQFCSP